MIEITLPNGDIKEFDKNITAKDIVETISSSLAKKTVLAEIDGELKDLSSKIDKNSSLKFITNSDNEALETLRHDAAHLLAQAVKELFPDTQITIGPVIKDGFYYDFLPEKPFTEEDLQKIEKKMQHLASQNFEIQRQVMKRDDAVSFFRNLGEEYKAEIIESIPNNEEISLYSQGNFIDLCRGPHFPSTKFIRHFKLLRVAGAYWRGDSNNRMLSRIYGTAWQTEEDLKKYLQFLEDVKESDHRRIGTDLRLFHLSDDATGQIFWHSKGYRIFTEIENYIRNIISEHGYQEVKTPLMVNRQLWEKSGHWDKFRDNMYSIADGDFKDLAIKPMNCPCHVQIFNQTLHSYRDLPLKMSEFGTCHRNEPSGSLHGIMRLRGFTQDDAHIFCEESSIASETVAFCDLLRKVYQDFGFTEVKVKFSTRPEIRAGSDKTWDRAEEALKNAILEANIEYEINEGEGAFYGPKLEFVLTDALGREWQCGTLQVDFVLPNRLEAYYIDSNGDKRHPVMLHRAILGSLERFIGILIENYKGKLPLWLAPIQVTIATITTDCNAYAKEIYNQCVKLGIRAYLDTRNEKINLKVRESSLQKIPYIFSIGKKEVENSTVSLRKLGINFNETVNSQDAIISLTQEISSKTYTDKK